MSQRPYQASEAFWSAMASLERSSGESEAQPEPRAAPAERTGGLRKKPRLASRYSDVPRREKRQSTDQPSP